MSTSPTLEALSRERLAHLEALCLRMIGCRVVVEVPQRKSETAKVPIAVSVAAQVATRGLVQMSVAA